MRELRHMPALLALLLPTLNDTRDRSTLEYREWLGVLVEDIRRRGIRSPILVIREGRFFRVVAGETRRQAAILAGLERVPVMIVEGELTQFEKDCETLLENLMRHDLTEAEKAASLVGMLEENDLTPAKLARRLPVSEVEICRAIRINRVPDDLKALMGKGPGKLGPTIAAQLGRLETHDEMREVAKLYLGELRDRDGVVNEVNRRLGRKPPKQKPVRAVVDGVAIIIAERDAKRAVTAVATIHGQLEKIASNGGQIRDLPRLLKGS